MSSGLGSSILRTEKSASGPEGLTQEGHSNTPLFSKDAPVLRGLYPHQPNPQWQPPGAACLLPPYIPLASTPHTGVFCPSLPRGALFACCCTHPHTLLSSLSLPQKCLLQRQPLEACATLSVSRSFHLSLTLCSLTHTSPNTSPKTLHPHLLSRA